MHDRGRFRRGRIEAGDGWWHPSLGIVHDVPQNVNSDSQVPLGSNPGRTSGRGFSCTLLPSLIYSVHQVRYWQISRTRVGGITRGDTCTEKTKGIAVLDLVADRLPAVSIDCTVAPIMHAKSWSEHPPWQAGRTALGISRTSIRSDGRRECGSRRTVNWQSHRVLAGRFGSRSPRNAGRDAHGRG